MSTSIIDGTVEEAVAGRSRGSITVYKSIRFQLDDGSSRTITKAVVKHDIAEHLVPGSRARFYLFNAFDIRGIHGVRTPDGRSVYASVDGEIPLLGLGLMILAAVGWFLMGKGQTESKAQFDGDAAFAGPAAATAA